MKLLSLVPPSDPADHANVGMMSTTRRMSSTSPGSSVHMGTLPHPSCLGRRHHRARCTESANAHLILGARARAWAIIESRNPQAESVSYFRSIQDPVRLRDRVAFCVASRATTSSRKLNAVVKPGRFGHCPSPPRSGASFGMPSTFNGVAAAFPGHGDKISMAGAGRRVILSERVRGQM